MLVAAGFFYSQGGLEYKVHQQLILSTAFKAHGSPNGEHYETPLVFTSTRTLHGFSSRNSDGRVPPKTQAKFSFRHDNKSLALCSILRTYATCCRVPRERSHCNRDNTRLGIRPLRARGRQRSHAAAKCTLGELKRPSPRLGGRCSRGQCGMNASLYGSSASPNMLLRNVHHSGVR